METKTNERLSVENFAGMRHVVLDIGRLNLLIGPQATGKSVCAKLLYFFRTFDKQIVQAAMEGKSKREFKDIMTGVFCDCFPEHSWPSGPFRIQYKSNGSSFRISRKAGTKSVLAFQCPTEFNDLYEVLLDKARERRSAEGADAERDRFMTYATMENMVKAKVGGGRPINQYFVPAGRSFFLALQGSIFSVLASNSVNISDPFLLSFGALYERARNLSVRSQLYRSASNAGVEPDTFERLIQGILKGRYMREENEDILVSEDGRKVRVANASSGQQAALPLVLILRYLCVASVQDGGVLYVEEPEAHLFPTSQRNMVELLATVYNTSRSTGLQLIVTTHSPYILTAFNNLIQAGILAQELRMKKDLLKLHKIVPAEYTLLPSDFSAYSLVEGEAHNLMDKKTGLMLADVVDQVSDDLAEEFHRLLELV